MALNINREITDQFYRYKMPKLLVKVEGKGNGIKTVIINMTDVAKALSRPPTYPTKYFGCELGAQTQFDSKNDRYIVNGSHDGNRLQDLLDGFIKRFVLCGKCDNPETDLAIKKNTNVISLRCMACGHTTYADMRHKLTTFIIKNPPEPSDQATPHKKCSKTKQNGEGELVLNGNSENNEENDALDDDDEWVVDTSIEAVKLRMKENLTTGIEALTITSDLEKPESERINIFYNFIKNLKANGKFTDISSVDDQKEIANSVYIEASRLDICDKAPLVLAELLFDDSLETQFKKYRGLFLRFTNENQKAQNYLLGAIEILIGKVHTDTLMPKVTSILHKAYMNDLLDEEVLIMWSKKISKKYVDKQVSEMIHEKAKSFIDWLETAPEESDSEDPDVEVDFTNSAPSMIVTKNKEEDIKVKDEDDNDIMIDDI